MVKKVVKRFAFTLIELIFAIVIIGLAVIALPSMSSVNSNNIEDSLVQEAVYGAAEKLSRVLAYHWDDNSIISGDSFASVIDLSGNCTSGRKPGHINQTKHRKCNTNTTAGATTIANYSLNDTVEAAAVSLFDSTSAHGYKKNYNSQVTVTASPFGIVDLKQVDIAVTLTDGTPVLNLSAFAANIGEVDFHHRTY